jgi:clan AA aspartic protease (TIGR02281 family)
VAWLGSVAAAYLFGQSQAPGQPSAASSAVPDSAALAQIGSGRIEPDRDVDQWEQLRLQQDWEALAAQAVSGDRAAELLLLAQDLGAAGRSADALALLDAFLRQTRSNAALFVQSDLLMMSGQMLAALEPLFQVLDYPETPEQARRARQRLDVIINAREQQLINSDDLAGLVMLFQQLSQRDPGYDRYRLKLAGWLLRSGDLTAARAQARELGSNGVSDAEREALAREIELAGSSLPFLREGPGYFADVVITAPGRSGSGAESVRLLVDTGATTTGISVALLQRLGARHLNRQVRVNTANGVTQMAMYRVSGLRVGNIEIADLEVLALPDPPHGAAGLLGMDVLDQLPKAVGTP